MLPQSGRENMTKEEAAIRPISADSHVAEPPHCYKDYIDPKYRDRAPEVRNDPKRGPLYHIPGLATGVAMGTLASAGKNPKDIKLDGTTWDEIYKGAWDGKARIADMDRDGVAAEIVYPSIGMVLCGHEDADYKHACFQAYNRWLKDFVSAAPDRIYGAGQTAVRSVEEAIEDFRAIKEAGFKTVMMPLWPSTPFDYDDERFDPLWRAAVELDLPVSFHISAGGNKKDEKGNFIAGRGPSLGVWIGVIRSVQDLMAAFVFTGLFDRIPDLKMVWVESDAGWLPHMQYRLDHAYARHRYWMKGKELKLKPSEYFPQNFHFTFQDDKSAFDAVRAGLLDPNILMWASDFPHSDATWPWSQDVIAEQAKGIPLDARKKILRDNVTNLYKLKIAA